MLSLQDLTRRFGDLTAVDGVSFDVPAGEMVGFVGGNGAGKTTTMRMIMGVLAATSGEVHWQGRVITSEDRRTFGYMPEERGLYPKQPVLQQLLYLARLRGEPATHAKQHCTELLERFNLGDRAKDKVEKLSLGNQQRVQIIAAVLGSPQALILDEPFSGLDPDAVDQMVELLHEYTAQGVPVLFSSHQLDLVERVCNRLVILRKGQVAQAGTADELRARAASHHRIVLTGDAGWVREHPGLSVLSVEGPEATFDITTPGAEQSLLTAALGRGGVTEFGRVRPTLADIYRAATA